MTPKETVKKRMDYGGWDLWGILHRRGWPLTPVAFGSSLGFLTGQWNEVFLPK